MKEQKIEDVKLNHYSAVNVTVGHKMFKEMGAQQMRKFGIPGAKLFDIKGIFGKQESDVRL